MCQGTNNVCPNSRVSGSVGGWGYMFVWVCACMHLCMYACTAESPNTTLLVRCSALQCCTHSEISPLSPIGGAGLLSLSEVVCCGTKCALNRLQGMGQVDRSCSYVNSLDQCHSFRCIALHEYCAEVTQKCSCVLQSQQEKLQVCAPTCMCGNLKATWDECLPF